MAQLVRFADRPEVFDISGGQFEHIPSVEEFNKRGFSFQDVQVLDRSQITPFRRGQDLKVFASIDGKDIHFQSPEVLRQAGFDFPQVQVRPENNIVKTSELGATQQLDGAIPPVLDDQTSALLSGTAGLKERETFLTKELERLTKEQEAAKKEQKGFLDKLLKPKETAQSVETKLMQERTRLGVEQDLLTLRENIASIANITTKINELNTNESRAIEMSRQRTGETLSFQTAEQNKIQREFAIQRSGLSAELGAKAAVSEMLQGNINQAESLISKTINAMTFDISQERADLEFWIDRNDDKIAELDKDIRDIINVSLTDIKEREISVKEDIKNKMNIISDAAKFGVDLGLSVQQIKNTGIDEIIKLYSTRVSAAVSKQQALENVQKVSGLAPQPLGTIDILNEMQSAVNQLNLMGLSDAKKVQEALNDLPKDVQPFVGMTKNTFGDFSFTFSKPTAKQLQEIAENRKANTLYPNVAAITSNYNNERTARDSYDAEIIDGAHFVNNGSLTFEDTISRLKKEYGMFISEQEIRGTLQSLVKQPYKSLGLGERLKLGYQNIRRRISTGNLFGKL